MLRHFCKNYTHSHNLQPIEIERTLILFLFLLAKIFLSFLCLYVRRAYILWWWWECQGEPCIIITIIVIMPVEKRLYALREVHLLLSSYMHIHTYFLLIYPSILYYLPAPAYTVYFKNLLTLYLCVKKFGWIRHLLMNIVYQSRYIFI